MMRNRLELTCADTPSDRLVVTDDETEIILSAHDNPDMAVVVINKDGATQLRDWLTQWLEGE